MKIQNNKSMTEPTMKTALPYYPITKKIWTTIKPAITGWSTALQTTLKAHPSAPQQLLFVSAWKPEITSRKTKPILLTSP